VGGEVLRGVLAVLARAARAVRDGSVTYFYLTDVARPAKRAPCFLPPADRVNLEKTWETTRTERQAKRIHERIACRTSLFDADPGLSSLFEKAMEPMLKLLSLAVRPPLHGSSTPHFDRALLREGGAPR